MSKLDLMNVMKAADDLLAVTENPRHRAILQNYRRHALLEIAGRWEEILTQELMVASPSYRITEKGQTLVMNGMDEVAVFYRQIAEAGLTVFGPMEEELVVWDWGLASEAHFAHIRCPALIARCTETEDVVSAITLDRERWMLVAVRGGGARRRAPPSRLLDL